MELTNLDEYLATLKTEGIEPGSILIDENGKYYRVDGFTWDKKWIFQYSIWKDGDWVSQKSYQTYDELHYYRKFIRMPIPINQAEKEYLVYLNDPSKYEDNLELSSSTDLVASDSKRLDLIYEEINRKRDLVLVMSRIAASKLQGMLSYSHRMKEELKKIRKVIKLFETYLGVYEEIVTLVEGERAGDDVPISVRQLVLFMDEEAGITEYGGIDWERIDWFDNWIKEDQRNLAQVLPETKGIVVLKPSRQKRSNDPWIIASDEANNAMSYLLIRNGDCVWRVWTSFVMGQYFFPNRSDMHKILDMLETHDRDRAEDEMLRYHRNALLVQGLLDRTDLLIPTVPMPSIISDENMSMLNYIFDGEPSLTEGRLTFRDWQLQINATLDIGGRVIYIKDYDQLKGEKSRYTRYYQSYSWLPPMPETGLYQIEAGLPKNHPKHDGDFYLVIYYNPGDMVWSWTYYEERKNRVGYKLEKNDSFILNYDQVTFEDIDYYLRNRYERENFLKIIPMLLEIRRRLREEKEYEENFVALLANKINPNNKKLPELIWNALRWWKVEKVKWKRALTKDDSKAWRMIEQKVRKWL